MKRKQLIALIGSVSLALTSCSGAASYAAEETEIFQMETSLEDTALTEAESFSEEETVSPEETQTDAQSESPTDEDAGEMNEGAGDEETGIPLPAADGHEEGSGQETETQGTAQTESDASEKTPSGKPASDPEQTSETEVIQTGPDAEKTPEPLTEAALPLPKETKADAGSGAQTDPSSQVGSESEELTEGETETIRDAETEELTEEETEILSEEETEDLSEEETEGMAETYDYGYVGGSGNGGYYWDESWYISPDFRFTQVDKEYALVGSSPGTFVYEENDASSRKVGEIPYSGAVCILKEAGEGWLYVESGDIRGFVPESALKTGDQAKSLIDAVGEEALTQGDLLCEKADNEAFTYTKTTSYPVIASKVYAMSLASTWIYEYPDMTSRFVGDIANGALMYVLKDLDNGWCFIESGDVRGFIPVGALLIGDGAEGIAKDLGEESVPLAEELISPQDNRSVYFTLLSVKSAGSSVGSDICRSAVSFVGNLPYVYGGTSLSSGADCSGFVQSIFAGYGISLPRTAQEQGAAGQAVPTLKDAKPGDIIYYASGPHVGIYLGNGKVVQCSGREYNTSANPGKGPTISDAAYMPITSIRRYLIERDENSSDGAFRTDDTPYSKEQLEIIWAVVAQEDNGSYDGALAVISSAMNRTESDKWSYEGSNAFAQLTAAGQYCYSMDDYWVPRLNGNVPDYVKQAVDDCLKKGIRNHSYTSFRSTRGKTTGADAVQIGGNWYFGS